MKLGVFVIILNYVVDVCIIFRLAAYECPGHTGQKNNLVFLFYDRYYIIFNFKKRTTYMVHIRLTINGYV